MDLTLRFFLLNIWCEQCSLRFDQIINTYELLTESNKNYLIMIRKARVTQTFVCIFTTRALQQ